MSSQNRIKVASASFYVGVLFAMFAFATAKENRILIAHILGAISVVLFIVFYILIKRE